MNGEKIKLLFGTYSDEYNAQDINTQYISRHIDKKKFEIHMFTQHNANMCEGVVYHRLSKISIIKRMQKFLHMVIHKYDGYYLPRLERVDLLFARFFHNRKIISSVEIEADIHDDRIKNFFCNDVSYFFAINEKLKKDIAEVWERKVPVLYLGFEKPGFQARARVQLRTVAFAGGLVSRKRPELVLELAKIHPELQFRLIGGGSLQNALEERIKTEKIENVQITGKIKNIRMYEELNKCDLLVIVSENEGQPKVALEAASVGVPTVYIKNNYEINFICNGKTGYAVHTFEELNQIIDMLYSNSESLEKMSMNVMNAVAPYSWDSQIKTYENYFFECINK